CPSELRGHGRATILWRFHFCNTLDPTPRLLQVRLATVRLRSGRILLPSESLAGCSPPPDNSRRRNRVLYRHPEFLRTKPSGKLLLDPPKFSMPAHRPKQCL